MHTQTQTLNPTSTQAVTQETWPGTETWDEEEATFGGPTPLREVTVPDSRECPQSDDPDPGR